MNKPIVPGGGALNEMSRGCAERAMTYLVECWLAHRGLTADITVLGPFPPETVERLRRERAGKIVCGEAANQ